MVIVYLVLNTNNVIVIIVYKVFAKLTEMKGDTDSAHVLVHGHVLTVTSNEDEDATLV